MRLTNRIAAMPRLLHRVRQKSEAENEAEMLMKVTLRRAAGLEAELFCRSSCPRSKTDWSSNLLVADPKLFEASRQVGLSHYLLEELADNDPESAVESVIARNPVAQPVSTMRSMTLSTALSGFSWPASS